MWYECGARLTTDLALDAGMLLRGAWTHAACEVRGAWTNAACDWMVKVAGIIVGVHLALRSVVICSWCLGVAPQGVYLIACVNCLSLSWW
jgi:hypothetical protein